MGVVGTRTWGHRQESGGVQIQKGSKQSFYGHGEDHTNLSAIKFQRAAHAHTYKGTQILKTW